MPSTRTTTVAAATSATSDGHVPAQRRNGQGERILRSRGRPRATLVDEPLAIIERHSTAISRTDLSRPATIAIDDGLLEPGTTFFDYGCGRGGDVQRLSAMGYEARGWDPFLRPGSTKSAAD